MLNLEEAISILIKNTEEVFQKNGFEVINPQGFKKGDSPLVVDGEHSYVDFKGTRGKVRIEFFGKQALLFYTNVKADEATDEDFTKASVNFFDLETFDEKDLKSLANEFNDTVESKFGSKKLANGKTTKLPAPISKSAAKSGAQSYDGYTLANRLTALYPELKDAIKAHLDEFPEFLPEEFFTKTANSLIIDTIRRNQKQEVTKLFKIINDLYENGTGDTQGLIAVTILGEMNNDSALCETATAYMCDDLRDVALLVNKFLATPKGKAEKKKLLNPPPYKPKKEKKPGFFAQAMSQAGPMPPM
ncbi:MAG: hypothetical protein RR914_01185 [Oscillospiraceae bacterium]